MEAREYYTWLLTRYYQGKASEEEVDELFTELGKDMDAEAWTSMIEDLHLRAGVDLQYDPVRWQQMANRITGSKVTGKIRPMKRWRMAAAAAVLVVAGLLIFNRNDKSKELAKVQASDTATIAPGGNRAQLTLADGRVIDLEAAATGKLAADHGAMITKNSDGSLVYKKEGNVASNAMHKLSTPRGGQYQLRLPDGTRVWLNAASSITYPASFTGAVRKISLSGEAYFEVAHDPRQPFRVDVNGLTEVEVLGTSFNVNAYTDEPATKTTLVEGSVKMIAGKEAEILKPGEQASWQHNKLKVTDKVDVASVLAWKNGQFPMKNIDLATFMRQVSRWYDVDVEIRGNNSKIIFGGFMSRDVKLNTVMKALEVYGIKTKLENKTLIVE